MDKLKPLPSLPQTNSKADKLERAFQVRVARTSYNYTTSYPNLDPMPISADVPKGESFSAAYDEKILGVFHALVDNFIAVVEDFISKEVADELNAGIGAGLSEFRTMLAAFEDKKFGVHVVEEMEDVRALLRSAGSIIDGVEHALLGLAKLPGDFAAVLSGIKRTFHAMELQGGAAFLRFGLYDLISPENRSQLFTPQSYAEYLSLFQTLARPQTVLVEPQAWMKLGPDEHPWQQDWFFGYQQIGGYNTTMLRGVTAGGGTQGGVSLAELQQKFPITDGLFQSVIGDSSLTLQQAATANLLYVVDYKLLEGVPSNVVFGQQRYHGAPIALFYWNRQPPPGYPPLSEGVQGVMQPVAIQLEQTPDPRSAPIFTPKHGNKWEVAKYFVQSACAIEHETVAHLGSCHLMIEPMILAAHRQFSLNHPLLVLLIPHFRFTLAINSDALDSLVVPGGVIEANLAPTIEGSMTMVRNAHLEWRFDEQMPKQLFARRAVTANSLPDFPFRDDTLLLWEAIHRFVEKYVGLYYTSEQDLLDDYELQAWVTEMTAPDRAFVRGMDGLVNVGSDEAPEYQIQSINYLVDVITHIIYIAGPLHASLNYAQYPMMSYGPSVSGIASQPPPTADSPDEDPIKWMPPLEIGLYQVSFTYLLSNVQYDTLGVYDTNPREPYFVDLRADQAAIEMSSELLLAELKIRDRNRWRPIPYLFQLPSRVPNSISI
ncbi:Arachidonate 15-lipoxygenase precursor [Enhygromyxa salina]|uniref:Arachidonate 15-lipoxygenase n=1 Tax=Enhygromyxa salina TaxID=215803 RepID=A0A0C2CRS9_9BACT|nr:lipoxygenase family protein [Enhygromyxa salina]KIG12340.1 Arachidonate 15-lipoxygenase precursor [Enhygromyxa salina]